MSLAVAAESRAGEGCDPGLVEEQIRQHVRGMSGSGDTREGVEGPLGRYALDAGELVQAGHYKVPTGAELGEHALDGILRPAQGGEPGVLGGGAGTGV